MEKLNHVDHVSSALAMAGGFAEALLASGVYELECRDADGNLKWTETVKNVVVTQGKNYLLDTILAGSAFTAAWYFGLFTAGTPNAADTYASQTTGAITQATNHAARPAVTWVTASAGSKSSNGIAITFTGSATITGVQLMAGGSGITTPGNTSATGGILLSEGLLGTARAVISGDSLTITYTLSV